MYDSNPWLASRLCSSDTPARTTLRWRWGRPRRLARGGRGRGGAREGQDRWAAFLRHLRGRAGARLFVSAKCPGLAGALAEFHPRAGWQRCAARFSRNTFPAAPQGKAPEVAALPQAVHAPEDLAAAPDRARQAADKPDTIRPAKAAGLVRAGPA